MAKEELINNVLVLGEPKFVGKFPTREESTLPQGESKVDSNTRGWTFEVTSPKIYSWAKKVGDYVETSEPLKFADLKHGDTIYVETLFGLSSMKVEIVSELGQTHTYAVNEGLIGHIVADEEGFAGCPMTINRKALEKAKSFELETPTSK